MGVNASEQTLRRLVDAIVADDAVLFSELLDRSRNLAAATFSSGANRQKSVEFFVAEIGRYIYAGDSALHFAAASYRHAMVETLIAAGADVRAKNRRGAEPLHSAAVGTPGSSRWNPAGQAATIVRLIEAGADLNAQNMDGVTPLHLAVRTRCSAAVRTLLTRGADPAIRNKNGSTAIELARRTTGRSGSGSAEAKSEQQEILRLLQGR